MLHQAVTMTQSDLEALSAEMELALMRLTPRQREFVMVYSVEMNIKEAADKSGITVHSGYRMRDNWKVSKALGLLQKKRELESGLDAGWKRLQLLRIIEAGMQPVVIRAKNGEVQGYRMADAAASLAALNMLCKMDGNFAQKPETEQNLTEIIETARERASLNNDARLTLPP